MRESRGVQGGFAESCFHDKVLARLKGKLPTIMRTLTGGELGWEEREEREEWEES